MAILDKIKMGIDTPRWLQLKPFQAAHAAGTVLCCDHRNGIWNDNAIYQVASTANLYRFSEWYNGHQLMTSSLALAASAVGGLAKFAPAYSLYGVIGAGSSTTKIVTSTALTNGSAIAALGVNQLVKTDMPQSYMIRITGKTSGKTEQRTIVANTASATPVLYLDHELTFTPAANDEYQIFVGNIYIIAATTAAAGQTRVYCVGNNAVSNGGSVGITTGTAASGAALDETLVPYDMITGEGFIAGSGTYDVSSPYDNGYLRCLVATASAAGTLTGQVTGGDSIVAANEYRNFQIRIVEDTGTPAAVGQRRIIASHTAGTAGATAPVYTLGSNWATTPSATAKYVIEYPNILVLQSNTQAGMLTYNMAPNTVNNGTANITAFTWSSTYLNSTHGAAVAAGTMCFPAYAHQPVTQSDGTRLSRHSYIYFFRGNSATLDRFDLAGAINGAWSDNVTYNNPISFTAGSSGDIDNYTFNGEYAYINEAASARMYQFNIASPSLVPWVQLPTQSGTAAGQDRVCVLAYVPPEPIAPSTTVTPEDKMSMIYVQSHLSTSLFRSDIIG